MLPTKRVNLSRIAPWLCFAFTLSLTLSTLSLSYDYSQYSLFSLCFFFFALLLLFGLVDVRRNCTKIAIPLAGQQHNSQPTINLRYYFRQCSKYICIFILVFLGVYLVYATMINRERVFVIHNNRAWRYTDLFVDVDIKAPRSPEQGKEGISAIDAVYVVSYEPMEARREVGRLASRILQSTLFLYPLLYAPLFSSQHSISLFTKFLYIYIYMLHVLMLIYPVASRLPTRGRVFRGPSAVRVRLGPPSGVDREAARGRGSARRSITPLSYTHYTSIKLLE